MEKIIEYKKSILAQLLALAQEKEKTTKENQENTQKRANEEEGAMQSRYSTFKAEGQFLAGGLKSILEDLKANTAIIQAMTQERIKVNERIEPLAIAEVEFDDGSKEKFFVIPGSGGEKIDDLTMISPRTPLGKALMGKEAGDNFTLKVGDKARNGEVIYVT